MCGRFWTWKMARGSKKADQCAFECDAVLLPCGQPRNVELLDSASRGAFSSPLPVAIGLVGCRFFAFGQQHTLCSSCNVRLLAALTREGPPFFLGLPPTRNARLVPPGICGSWPLLTVWDPRFSWLTRDPRFSWALPPEAWPRIAAQRKRLMEQHFRAAEAFWHRQ